MLHFLSPFLFFFGSKEAFCQNEREKGQGEALSLQSTVLPVSYV